LGTSNIKRKLNIQVELNNVFAYPTRPDQMIFNVLNLKIDAGKTVALVGLVLENIPSLDLLKGFMIP
jgi:ATP-binding cassette subfamily B (MDR/TAP) protein 1